VALVEPAGSWNPTDIALEAKADSAGSYKLSGTKSFVCDAPTADLFIVPARGKEGLLLAVVPANAPGVRITATPGIDATRKLADVEFAGAATTEILAIGAAAEAALARSIDVATLVACGEMLGVMQWILGHAVEYAKTRQQFGKTIGTFQAVQHMCADMVLLTESTRSAVYYAAWALDAQPQIAARDVAIAKAYASDAVREVANRGVQIHGGIGFTWEHDLQLYYKRAKALEIAFGDAAYHRERLARMAFDA
jgi:alkylation response protein AidB-like acyl-CoA dehydrogenase